MNDFSDLLPHTAPHSQTVSLGHNATAVVRDGRIECIRIPDPHGNTERAAHKRAVLRFRDKRAQKSYQHQLFNLALTAHAAIPPDHAADVEAVRAGWQADLARRAAINAAADALRATLQPDALTPLHDLHDASSAIAS